VADSFSTQTNAGAFVPTNLIWDVQQLYSIDVNSTAFKELLVRLYQNINNIALVLNIKDSGYYAEQEFVNGQLFFPNPLSVDTGTNDQIYRQVFRTVVNFGPLPNATTISIAHDIDTDDSFSFTRIYGAASTSNGTLFIPLPFSSPTLNQNIKMTVDVTNVNITTAIDYSAYTTTYIVLEYLKQ
jgi:hypothetical protein